MITRKSYFVFLIVALIYLINGFISNDEMLDVNIHDTYYVIAKNHFNWLLSILSALSFVVYFSFDKFNVNLLKSLTTTHILVCLLSMIGLFFPYHLIFKADKFPLFDDNDKTNFYLTISAFLFIISQFVFILNIFATVIKYIRVFVTKKQ